MKKGDNIYCVKDYKHIYPLRSFKKGEYYKIDEIIEYEYNKLNYHINKAIVNNIIFTLLNESNMVVYLNFHDYFITEKELRKIKLQKIMK